MRKSLVAACLFLGAAAVMPAPIAFAAVDAAGVAQIQGILAQYPDGGDALVAAIMQALEANPDLAEDVDLDAQTANAPQQQAMGTAMADAANFFEAQGTSAGIAAHDQIVTAAGNGPALLIVALDAAITPTAGGPNGGPANTLPTSLTTTQQNSCVSPSRPGPC